MPAIRRTLLAIAAACPTWAPAQDILHYKFDGGCDAMVVNHASASPAPATGSIVTGGNPASAWIPGRFGSALGCMTIRNNFMVDTGWAPASISGSLSWACWLRHNPLGSLSGTGLIGNVTGGWYLLGNDLVMSNAGGNSVFTSNFFVNLINAGWTHFACVVDSSNQVVTYYLNGQPQTPVPATGPFLWQGTNSLMIGMATSLINGRWDIDEFILANRVMGAAEIAMLASDARAADARFGVSGGPGLAGNGQRPVPGNLNYGLVLNAPAGLGLLLFASNHCSLAGGSIPLPADLGVLHPVLSGVQGHVDSDLGTVLLGLGSGATQIPFALPNLPGLSGYVWFAQALTWDPTINRFAGSNAVAVGIGR